MGVCTKFISPSLMEKNVTESIANSIQFCECNVWDVFNNFRRVAMNIFSSVNFYANESLENLN